jgi:hypothetical protein
VSWPVGTIVVCVDDFHPSSFVNGHCQKDRIIGLSLSKGGLFTIRGDAGAVRFLNNGVEVVAPGVLLNENCRIANGRGGALPDYPWCADRFRLAESSHSESSTARQSAEAK